MAKKKRGVGRPKGPTRKVEIIHSRVAPVVKQAFQREAKSLGLSDTQMLEKILCERHKIPWPVRP